MFGWFMLLWMFLFGAPDASMVYGGGPGEEFTVIAPPTTRTVQGGGPGEVFTRIQPKWYDYR